MITEDQLRDEVVRLGTEYPNAKYITTNYGTCYYNKGKVANGPDAEGCIFGQALRNLGVPAESLTKIQSINLVLEALNIEYGGYSFMSCQRSQDLGCTWGEAIKALM